MEYYSAIKRTHDGLCTDMVGPRAYHTEWSKSDRERQVSDDIAYMWHLKKLVQVNVFTKQK